MELSPKLHCEFLGIKLRSPIVMASSPITESMQRMEAAVEAGAGALVLKSASQSVRRGPNDVRRLKSIPGMGLFMLSTQARELMGYPESLELCRKAAGTLDAPIIASIGLGEFDPAKWIEMARGYEDSGAAAVQIDGYYLPKPWCTARNEAPFRNLLGELQEAVRMPVVLKLNAEVPISWVEDTSSDWPIGGWSLLDSVRVANPLEGPRFSMACRAVDLAGQCSMAGPWLKPLSMAYTAVLHAKSDKPVLAGGGVHSASDVLEFMIRGGTAVQVATAVLLEGFGWIGKALLAIEELLGDDDLVTFIGKRRHSTRMIKDSGESRMPEAKARLDAALCTGCRLCRDQTMCEAFGKTDGRPCPAVDLEVCDGCGLCVDVCPAGALSIESR